MINQSGAVRTRVVKKRITRIRVGEIARVVRAKVERPKGIV
jgi:hypothetical protein